MRNLKWIAGLALAGLLLYRPAEAAGGAARALESWYAAVAPAVFPFLALMPLLTCDAAVRAYGRLLGGVMGRLFDLPGAAAPALVIGMVAGSPAGALAARRIAARSGMDRGRLQRLAVAIAGFSPAFLLAGVGAGMLGSAAMGGVLLRAQAISQLAMLALLRGLWRHRKAPVPLPPGAEEEPPLRGAVLAALTIGGWMALFGALAAAVRALTGGPAADALLCAMDVPSGARLVAGLPLPLQTRTILLAALCGFGGVCVGLQNLAALKGCGMGAAEYFALRLLAAGLGAGATVVQMRLPQIAPTLLPAPLHVSALAMAALAVPVLLKLRKSIS